MRWLLKNAPFPYQILSMRFEQLVDGLKLASNGRQGVKRAQVLIDVASKSIGVTEGIVAAAERMKILVEMYDMLLNQIEQVEEAMKQALFETGLAVHLLSVPGVGEISSAQFLAEIGNPEDYKNLAAITKTSIIGQKYSDPAYEYYYVCRS